jgi:hypothetical protein
VLQQQRAEPLPDPVRIGGDQGKIPMRFMRMMLGHAPQDGADILGDFRAKRSLHDRAHFRVIGLDARRQPQGGGARPVDDVGRAVLECPAAEGFGETGHHSEVFGRVGPSPARHRVGGKAKHNGIDRACLEARARGSHFRHCRHRVVSHHFSRCGTVESAVHQD